MASDLTLIERFLQAIETKASKGIFRINYYFSSFFQHFIVGDIVNINFLTRKHCVLIFVIQPFVILMAADIPFGNFVKEVIYLLWLQFIGRFGVGIGSI